MIDSLFSTWCTSRNIFASYLEKYSLDQLNKTPQGFNNNLIWNIGHVIAVQQSLIYKQSNLDMRIPDTFFEKYKSGSKPMKVATQEDIDEIKLYLLPLTDITKNDIARGIFTTYQSRTTATGFELATLNDGLIFNNYHEGMHLGSMLSIRKFV
jgi:hypothetical protein